jgi:hypothetical protein
MPGASAAERSHAADVTPLRTSGIPGSVALPPTATLETAGGKPAPTATAEAAGGKPAWMVQLQARKAGKSDAAAVPAAAAEPMNELQAMLAKRRAKQDE